MLDIAQNFMEFFVDESCGQCTPCREGTTKILEGIKILKQGKCSIAYLNKLKELAKTVEMASKCGLGQLSMKAFLSIVNNFQDEVLGRLPKEGSVITSYSIHYTKLYDFPGIPWKRTRRGGKWSTATLPEYSDF